MFVCRWRKASRLALALSALVVFILVPGAGRAQSNPPAWSSSAVYAVGDQVQTGGNVYRAITKISSPSGTSPAVDYTHWQLSQVLSNTTLLIGGGQTFPNLVTAWTYALYARVADGVYLHFYISTARGDFQEDFGGPFLLDHGSGARIAILGDNLKQCLFHVLRDERLHHRHRPLAQHPLRLFGDEPVVRKHRTQGGWQRHNLSGFSRDLQQFPNRPSIHPELDDDGGIELHIRAGRQRGGRRGIKRLALLPWRVDSDWAGNQHARPGILCRFGRSHHSPKQFLNGIWDGSAGYFRGENLD